MNVIIDLDGVIWLSGDPIEGSADAVERLRNAGHRLLFVTNNSNPTVEEQLENLSSAGVELERAELVTSAQAAASLVEAGETALVCGGEGVAQALEERDVKTVYEGEAHAVVVGEGRLDRSTLRGRVAGEIATRARQAGVPCHAVVGIDAIERFDARILDLQAIVEAATIAELEAAGEALAAYL